MMFSLTAYDYRSYLPMYHGHQTNVLISMVVSVFWSPVLR